MNTPKKIVILGAAESGVGSAVLAQKLSMEVFVSDAGKIADKYKKNCCRGEFVLKKVLILNLKF